MKRRNGFLIILFIAIVAVVLTIVFVNLFKDRSTTDLSQDVNTVIEEGYLNDEGETYTQIQDYLSMMETKLDSNEETKSYAIEAANYISLYKSTSKFAKFANKNLAFSSYNNVFKANKKAIKKGIAGANASANSLASKIEADKELYSGSDFWTIETWKTYSNELKSVMNQTFNTFDKLIVVYKASVDSSIYNNDFIEIVFDRTQYLLKDVEANVGQDKISGQKLESFVNSYLNTQYFEDYIYNEHLQVAVDHLKREKEESGFWQYFVISYDQLMSHLLTVEC